MPRLKDYCTNIRSIPELKLALQKQKVFRKRAREEELPSCLQTLMGVATWSADMEHKLMVLCALSPTDFIVDCDGVTSTMQADGEAIHTHGTPMGLLQKL